MPPRGPKRYWERTDDNWVRSLFGSHCWVTPRVQLSVSNMSMLATQALPSSVGRAPPGRVTRGASK